MSATASAMMTTASISKSSAPAQSESPPTAAGPDGDPFRLGKGWIYRFHYHGMVRGDEKALFRDCIYELPLRYMIKHGYLTPPERLDMPVVQYDFSRLQAQRPVQRSGS
jgi:hypothetical protein